MRKTYSILVAYNPIIEELNQAVDSLKKQTDIVIVCNNSDYDVGFEYEQVKVFNFGENLGIAKAQSIGMKWAFENGADFILQMDQDSIPNDDLVVKLLECYEELSQSGYKIGLVGSQNYDKDSLKDSIPKIDKGNLLKNIKYIKINQLISSGTIISKECYDVVGGMDDDLFIDAVDYEYCWRAIKQGFIVIKNLDAKIAHKFGNGTKRIFGIEIIIPSPIRHYYQYRNLLLLITRTYVSNYWKITNFGKQFLKLIFLPLIFDRKKERFMYICKGIKDGILRKKGRIDIAK
ncbi:glycosyltransferase family 2 protein [Aliarcobacter butzleri]|uniref:glycosyltransferase family 2 protein n=1 Tax=Aliarcobacter butzleri TaxID=28197 RepID=UPI00263CD465|nr:glycosyltransferase family 2 protein [Aliarcobacter butzleri]MDN5093706.1 glycosyltransferase family 2 protein [Aliarcobacter butzleri]